MRTWTPLTLGLGLLVAGGNAARVISTSAVTYCDGAGQTQDIQVTTFDVSLNADTNALTFDLSGSSNQPNLNLTASIDIEAYGMNPVNRTVNLCDFLRGVLCPLPEGDYSGQGTIDISEYTNDIPSIAYSLPDLEAQVTLRLYAQNGNNQEVACLQAGLTNGQSTQLPAVGWATAGIAAGAAIGSVHAAIFAHGDHSQAVQARVLDVMGFFQHVVYTGALSVNYPTLYKRFTANFAWSVGLIRVNSINNSINNLRARTGGQLPNDTTSSDLIDNGIVKRGMSYLPINSGHLASLHARNIQPTLLEPKFVFSKRDTVTATNSTINSLEQRGIAKLTNELNIPYANTFDTVLIIFLIAIAILLALLILIRLVVEVIWRAGAKGPKVTRFRREYNYFAFGNGLRLIVIAFGSLCTFAFYQFTLHDSWASIVLAAIALFLTSALLVATSGYVIYIARHPEKGPTHLYIRESYSKRWGYLYNNFKVSMWYFFVPLFLATVAKAGFVGFGQSNGFVQTIGLSVVELILLIYLIFARPFRDRSSNILNIFISIMRLVSFILLIVFVDELNIAAIPQTGIGLALLIVQSVVALVLAIMIIINLTYGILWGRKSMKQAAEEELNLEKNREKGVLPDIDADPRRNAKVTDRLVDDDLAPSEGYINATEYSSRNVDAAGHDPYTNYYPSQYDYDDPYAHAAADYSNGSGRQSQVGSVETSRYYRDDPDTIPLAPQPSHYADAMGRSSPMWNGAAAASDYPPYQAGLAGCNRGYASNTPYAPVPTHDPVRDARSITDADAHSIISGGNGRNSRQSWQQGGTTSPSPYRSSGRTRGGGGAQVSSADAYGYASRSRGQYYQ